MRWLAMVMVALVTICVGCRTQRQSVSETLYIHDTDTIHDVRIKVDSVVIKDSTVVLIKGDTVLVERFHTKERIRRDTILKTIKITKTYNYRTTLTKTVEVNVLHWWQTALMWAGGVSLLFLLLKGGFLLRKVIKR